MAVRAGSPSLPGTSMTSRIRNKRRSSTRAAARAHQHPVESRVVLSDQPDRHSTVENIIVTAPQLGRELSIAVELLRGGMQAGALVEDVTVDATLAATVGCLLCVVHRRTTRDFTMATAADTSRTRRSHAAKKNVGSPTMTAAMMSTSDVSCVFRLSLMSISRVAVRVTPATRTATPPAVSRRSRTDTVAPDCSDPRRCASHHHSTTKPHQ